MLALSSRPWLAWSDGGTYQLAPLSYDPLDWVAPFASEQVRDGLTPPAARLLE